MSFFQTICRQPSHFCQRPSVFTCFASSSMALGFFSSGLSRLNQDMQSTNLPRVGMASQGCESPIDLFGEHGAGELMRKRHGGEREQQVRAAGPGGWQAVVPAYQEQE